MFIVQEGIGPFNLGINPANGHIHLGQAEGGVVGLLPVNGNITLHATGNTVTISVGMSLNKLNGLNKHAAGTATGVIHSAAVGFQHFNQKLYHTLGGIEFTAALAFFFGEFGEEVFIHTAENIFFSTLGIT